MQTTHTRQHTHTHTHTHAHTHKPHIHTPTHIHSPGLSSGVAGELMTPGLENVEKVGDTGCSGLSDLERYCLQ